MSNCPLCGSPGDDLVFRFYCTDKDCANFVPGAKEESKGDPVGDLRLDDNGDIVLADGRHRLKMSIMAALGVRRDFFNTEYGCCFPPEDPEPSIPEFDLEFFCWRPAIHWKDKVPKALDRMLDLKNTDGSVALYDSLRDTLRSMVVRGELSWNPDAERWELHFVE
jgi:hypothetical protein